MDHIQDFFGFRPQQPRLGDNSSDNDEVDSTTTSRDFLPDSFRPTPYSVVIGRGKESRDVEGNRRLKELVSRFANEYSTAESKSDKTKIVKNIVSITRTACARGAFIKYSSTNKRWYEVDDNVAREKVGYTMREVLGPIYKSSSESKVARRRQEKNEDDGNSNRRRTEEMSCFSAADQSSCSGNGDDIEEVQNMFEDGSYDQLASDSHEDRKLSSAEKNGQKPRRRRQYSADKRRKNIADEDTIMHSSYKQDQQTFPNPIKSYITKQLQQMMEAKNNQKAVPSFHDSSVAAYLQTGTAPTAGTPAAPNANIVSGKHKTIDTDSPSQAVMETLSHGDEDILVDWSDFEETLQEEEGGGTPQHKKRKKQQQNVADEDQA